jgi:hypothetical protein
LSDAVTELVVLDALLVVTSVLVFLAVLELWFWITVGFFEPFRTLGAADVFELIRAIWAVFVSIAERFGVDTVTGLALELSLTAFLDCVFLLRETDIKVVSSEGEPFRFTNSELPRGGTIAASFSTVKYEFMHASVKSDFEIKQLGFSTLPNVGLYSLH